ncbi:MAG: hypothetical protein QOF01_2576 [Thermomicrobiales bacterium]|jgi:hypothetical protein|nr:hypothetical protein [Thermomicrobiales bacterium]MEA2531537.1 hypothetical protein [Thermomicrobiales bacterium]MEA2596107.1 hypothetical protein [Thermomicrobiales bacterium]
MLMDDAEKARLSGPVVEMDRYERGWDSRYSG